MTSNSVLIMISPKFVTKSYTSEPIEVKRATNNLLIISLRVDTSSLLISPQLARVIKTNNNGDNINRFPN